MIWPTYTFRILSLLSVPYLAQAGPFDGFTTTSLIPWTEAANGPFDFTTPPHVSIWYSAKNSPESDKTMGTVLVDTGSCGIILPMQKVSITNEEKIPENRAYQWLSSSQRLYVGWLVERYVWFNNGDTAREVRAHVKILAVQKVLKECERWEPTDGESCPGSSDDTSRLITSLMGISWGRMYDGQSFGSPSRNVLLQVDQMATRSLDTTFHHGWMIGAHGINVGLTNSVWDQGASGSGPGNSVIEVGLGNDPGAPPRDPSDPPHLYAWGEVAGCVSVGGSRCVECSVLLDTGMTDRTDAVMKKGDHASIRMPRDIVRTLQRDGTRLKDGQAVIIRLGRPGTTLTDLETFTYPHSPWPDCDITPAYSDVYEDAFHTPPRFPFANTGRHVYRRWSTGYDPVRGVARFVRHSLADIPQLLDPRLDVADCMGTRCGSSCPCHSCRA